MNWWLFFAVLLAPPLVTLLAARGGRDAEGAAIGIGLLGGGLGGIVCGAMLGWYLGKTAAGRITLGVVLAGVLAVVCVGMSCFGCFAGGFKLDFR
jgi:hypothetical protein